MLYTTVDRNKLLPYIIFKRKIIPNITSPEIVIRENEKGWMDKSLIVDWITRVWGNQNGALMAEWSMVILDSFREHTTDEVKTTLQHQKTDLIIIPGRLTSVLQPYDICLNKPFKAALKDLYTQWMAKNDHSSTPSGKEKLDFEMIEWIKTAWEHISSVLVGCSELKSFLKCGKCSWWLRRWQTLGRKFRHLSLIHI